MFGFLKIKEDIIRIKAKFKADTFTKEIKKMFPEGDVEIFYNYGKPRYDLFKNKDEHFSEGRDLSEDEVEFFLR